MEKSKASPVDFMTPAELKVALVDLGLSQAALAELVGASLRTAQYWTHKTVPNSVALLVLLMKEAPALIDLARHVRETRVATSTKASARRALPKYRDPVTGSVWSGRGAIPRWLKNYLAKGRSLEEFKL